MPSCPAAPAEWLAAGVLAPALPRKSPDGSHSEVQAKVAAAWRQAVLLDELLHWRGTHDTEQGVQQSFKTKSGRMRW